MDHGQHQTPNHNLQPTLQPALDNHKIGRIRNNEQQLEDRDIIYGLELLYAARESVGPTAGD